MTASFVQESVFSASPEELFGFHERPDAFRLLTPSWLGVEVHQTVSTLAPSDEVASFTTRFVGVPLRFEMAHTAYEPPHLFVDEQRRGLFRHWRHRHLVTAGGWQGQPDAMLRDEITFSHPLDFAMAPFVRRRLAKLFRFRHEVTRKELARQASSPVLGASRVVVSGATGLIGRHLVRVLQGRGAQVVALARDVRRAQRQLGDEVEVVHWDFHHPEEGAWQGAVDGAHSVVHLAGTPLFSQRWTAAFKREIERSRVLSTRQLVDAMERASRRPRSFVSASAVGIYGIDARRQGDEQSEHADDTLAAICTRWEAEARRAESLGIRSAQMRIGIVLSREAGALKEVLPLFRLGLGGVLGSGEPWINWIHVEDVARLFAMAVLSDEVSGPLNAVAPRPVRNETYARTLARVLGRPSLLRYPPGLLRLAIGEAGGFASGGARATADRAQALGYRFFFEDLEAALRNALQRGTPSD